MEITYRAVSRFVERFGKVDVIDVEGKTKMIEDDPDSVELALIRRFGSHFRPPWDPRTLRPTGSGPGSVEPDQLG